MRALSRLFESTEGLIDNLIVRVLPKWTNGVQGGILVRNQSVMAAMTKSKSLETVNNALFAAPVFKLILALVPIYGILSGQPKVENIDIRTTYALSFTGLVWSVYSLMVSPTAYILCGVNLTLFAGNTFNIYRYFQYQKSLPTLE